jgi:hypothetical protein
VNFEASDDSRIGQFKPNPFENREGAATRKFKVKGWATLYDVVGSVKKHL